MHVTIGAMRAVLLFALSACSVTGSEPIRPDPLAPLPPTVFLMSEELLPPSEAAREAGVAAVSAADIR